MICLAFTALGGKLCRKIPIKQFVQWLRTLFTSFQPTQLVYYVQILLVSSLKLLKHSKIYFVPLELKLSLIPALSCTKSRVGNIFFIQTHTPSLHLNLTAAYPDVSIRTMDLSKRVVHSKQSNELYKLGWQPRSVFGNPERKHKTNEGLYFLVVFLKTKIQMKPF